MKVRLIRLASTHNNLRTPVIEGECQDLPQEGRSFHMTAPPLDPEEQCRYITTTTVKSISWLPSKLKAIFTTKNSTYRLEVMQ